MLNRIKGLKTQNSSFMNLFPVAWASGVEDGWVLLGPRQKRLFRLMFAWLNDLMAQFFQETCRAVLGG